MTKQTVMETMSDDELISLARQGCEQAFSMIVRRFSPLLKKQAALFSSSQNEAEDLTQEGMLGLFSAVRTYNKSTASFCTYVSVCVRNRMLKAVKRSGAARQIPPSEIISIDDQKNFPVALSGCTDDPAQLIIQKEEACRLEFWLRKLLSSKEYKVLMLYLKAYAYEDIAGHLGISVKSVDNSLQRVRRKLVTVSFPDG